MTRLLVLSDIHGCVPAVEAVVAIERGGGFDAAVVAGDIGPNPDDFFRALAPLGCPVLYVYGNWDHELAYDRQFGAHAVHLLLRPAINRAERPELFQADRSREVRLSCRA